MKKVIIAGIVLLLALTAGGCGIARRVVSEIAAQEQAESLPALPRTEFEASPAPPPEPEETPAASLPKPPEEAEPGELPELPSPEPEAAPGFGAGETLVEMPFGAFAVPDGWVYEPGYSEQTGVSTDVKRFYVPEAEPQGQYPTNISVEMGANRYAEEDHEEFRRGIIRSMTTQMEMGFVEPGELVGSGSSTDNGYILYTFTLEQSYSTIVQHYIVGDYRYVMVHLTDFHDETAGDPHAAARAIADSFIWDGDI